MAGLGQAAGHEGGHGPEDHGFVAGREAFVVADGAAVLSDPGEGALYHPPAGEPPARGGGWPGDELQGPLSSPAPRAHPSRVDRESPPLNSPPPSISVSPLFFE